MDTIAERCEHVFCRSVEKGGSGSTAPATALGVFHGIQASVAYKLGRSDLSGIRVLVQGLGAVGALLATQLAEADADVLVSDVDGARVAASALPAVAPEDVIGTECDVYAPCALGGTITATTVEALRCRVVAGAANNQLASPELADRLHERGILYAPDYVINSGGVLHGTGLELLGWDHAQLDDALRGLGDTLLELYAAGDRSPVHASEALVARRRSGQES
jgi:leucine dehydrogenase